MLWIAESQSVAYLSYAERLTVEQFLGTVYNVVGNEILRGLATFHFHQFAEIAWGEITFFSEISHGWDTFGFSLIVDVIAQQ